MRKLLFAIALFVSCYAMAEKTIVTSGYGFGISASFKDSLVYFTEIQPIDSLYMSTKTKFILGRDYYSLQLKNYVETINNDAHRTCVFIYDTNKKKLEKRYNKLLNKYKSGEFLVKTIDTASFKFTSVDMSDSMEKPAKQKQTKQKTPKKQKASSKKPKKKQ